MRGCEQVYYCVVDTRAWLQDPAPLFHTNVEGLRSVLDVAVEEPITATLKRFVFTSTYATMARRRGHVATENEQIDRRKLTPYVESRGTGRRSGAALRGGERVTRRRHVRVDDLRRW